MVKLEVGMYVRYKNFANIFKIAKIVELELSDNDCYENYYHFDNEDGTLEGFITKASFNIIDLIEVGDYVNGHQVYEVDRECCRITLNGGDIGDDLRLTYLRPALGKNMGIKSIVTKEQFESVKYEVE